MNVKPGDIIVTESTGFVAWEIRRCQKRMGYAPDELIGTHVAVAVDCHGSLLEATGSGIDTGALSHYKNKGIKYHVLRNKAPMPKNVVEIAFQTAYEIDNKNAEKGEMKDYDYKLIAGLFFLSLGLKVKLSKWNNLSNNICSEFAIEFFNACKIITPKQDKIYWPAEFLRWKNEGFFKEIKQTTATTEQSG